MPNTLVMIPTVAELQVLEEYLDSIPRLEYRLCGFGLVEATINSFREAQSRQPDSIVLCGVAGSYDTDALPVGSVHCFDSVSQFGIGSWRESFQLPDELGFSSMPRRLTLQNAGQMESRGELVSVSCSGLFTREQVRAVHSAAVAEDMEGYGFALGAISAGVPGISIVRGISNRVGQPFEDWQIEKALHAVGNALKTSLVKSPPHV